MDFTDFTKETYDVLINYKFAPLIAIICDERINTWDALCIPWYFLNKIGSLDAETIVNQDISAILKSYFDSGQGEFPSGMSDEDREKWIRDTSLYIKGALDFFINGDTNPIEIFIRPENPEFRAVEVYFMLRRISGIGPKKANMIVRDFIYRSKGLGKRHPWFDQIKAISPNFKVVGEEETFIPIDVHVVKIFNRIFGRRQGNWEKEQKEHWWDYDIQMFSKLTFPEFPARLDSALWHISREFCSDNWKFAKCAECPIIAVCDSSRA